MSKVRVMWLVLVERRQCLSVLIIDMHVADNNLNLFTWEKSNFMANLLQRQQEILFRSSYRLPDIFVRFQPNLEFLDRYSWKPPILASYSLPVTWCIKQFNIQQLYALPTMLLCVLYLPGENQRLFPYVTSVGWVYNWDEKCLQRGTDWGFK